MRRIGDIARVNVLSALLSTVAGIAALLVAGADAIVPFVLAAPVATWLLGAWYVRRLPRLPRRRVDPGELVASWRGLVPLGAALMVSGIAGLLGQLLVRALVQRELGAGALGQFQAAWLISMTYIGFVLGAMATDYYPRLTAAIGDRRAANRLVNEQAEVALLLATPAFVALLGLAPWVVALLYTGEFSGAVGILRWQVPGDVLKVACWPLSFVLLAGGAGRAYLATEVLAYAVFVAVTWVGLPLIGVAATGIAFLLMYAVQLPVVYLLVRRRTGFRWTAPIRTHAAMALAGSVAVAVLSGHSEPMGAVAGVLMALGFAAHAFRRLAGRVRERDPGAGEAQP
jgi:PST family polysaccharide transporter